MEENECPYLSETSGIPNVFTAHIHPRNMICGHLTLIGLASTDVCSQLRQGTKALKSTQVYPKKYGKEVARLHLGYIVTWISNHIMMET